MNVEELKFMDASIDKQFRRCIEIKVKGINNLPKVVVVFALKAIVAVLRYHRCFLHGSNMEAKPFRINLVSSDEKFELILEQIKEITKDENDWEEKFHTTKTLLVHLGVTPSTLERMLNCLQHQQIEESLL